MVPTGLAALLMIHCNRLHPVASLVFGLLHYSEALPRIALPDYPGPLPPGPNQMCRQRPLEIPPLLAIRVEPCRYSLEIGGARRPLPNKKMVHMALALSYAILQRVPDLTYAEGVAIICVHNVTLSYLHTALNTLRHWVNATEVRREKYV